VTFVSNGQRHACVLFHHMIVTSAFLSLAIDPNTSAVRRGASPMLGSSISGNAVPHHQSKAEHEHPALSASRGPAIWLRRSRRLGKRSKTREIVVRPFATTPMKRYAPGAGAYPEIVDAPDPERFLVRDSRA
jgi:hypothetical protein